LARWAYPVSRALQKRFGRDSMVAMERALPEGQPKEARQNGALNKQG
jgi:hypothetical protein